MLFRSEARHRYSQARLGTIQLHRPLSLHVLTIAAVAAVAAVGVFLCTAEYTRKARVSGYLVPDRGVLRITPPQAATVVSRQVNEGQRVKAGDVLFVLALDAGNDQLGDGIARSLAERRRSLSDAAGQQQQLVRSQAQALDLRIAALQRELEQLDAEARLHAERTALAQQSLSRLEALGRDQFVSNAQVQLKREELLGLQAQHQSLARQREGLHREVLALQAQRRELPLRGEVQLGEIARDLAGLQAQGLEAEARRRLVLRSPSDGIVSTVLAEPGQPVTAGMALANVLPADTLMQAHLYAPSSAVGFLRAEQAVQLRYQAFPYQRFGQQQGRVLRIARTPLTATELATLALPGTLTQGPASEPLYRITVTLDRQSVAAYGEQHALTAGMQLDADVLLERRKLIEWIFEPLLSLAQRV
jgi:membrane fusion protein